MRNATVVLRFMVALLFVAGLGSSGSISREAQSAHGGVGALGIDMNTAGNTSTSLGPRDTCVSVNPGFELTFDITVTDVPTYVDNAPPGPSGTDSGGITGWQIGILYDEVPLTVWVENQNFLVMSTPGSSLFWRSDPTPDRDGSNDWVTSMIDTSSTTPEEASGVLTRVTIQVDPAAAAGLYYLRFDPANAVHRDGGGANFIPHDLTAAGIIAVGRSCPGTTFTVTKTADTGDGVCDADCSLREAIVASNAATGADAIGFNIAPGGIKTITPSSALPGISDSVTIDATTQPGFTGTPVIELSGVSAPSSSNGLSINVGGTIVRGFVINRFGSSGIGVGGFSAGNVAIEGNFIGTDASGTADLGNGFEGIYVNFGFGPSVTIGGGNQESRNVISGNGGFGVSVNAWAPSQIQGNRIGTDVSGTIDLGNSQGGVSISGSNITVGGTAPQAGNLISGNAQDGLRISGSAHTIQGNFIGTDVTGTRAISNGDTPDDAGIAVVFSSQNLIGGTSPGARNLISGNAGSGVELDNRHFGGNEVRGNFIGTMADGETPLANASNGVEIPSDSRSNTIADNVIAHNGLNGVLVTSTTGQESCCNAITANAIFSNAALGIDLGSYSGPNGVTPNDGGDGDVGGNRFQNFPVLTSVTSGAGSTTVEGTLNSAPNTQFRVEFFHSQMCDPSGHGEGEVFIGSTAVTTSAVGTASFSSTFPVSLPAASYVTATATDPSNNTSEFSAYRAYNVSEPDGDCDEWTDAVENGCGSNPSNHYSRPEVVGRVPVTDEDGDGLFDEPLPSGSGPYDCDGDGFIGSTEQYVFSATGTVNDQKKCGVDAWPPDFNNDTFVSGIDLSAIAAVIGENAPPAPVRRDIAPDPPDGAITGADLSAVAGRIGHGCSPP